METKRLQAHRIANAITWRIDGLVERKGLVQPPADILRRQFLPIVQLVAPVAGSSSA